MADMALLQGAMNGLKAAADIAIGLNKLNTMSEVNAKAIELQQIILNVQSTALSAQSQQATMIEEIRNLKEEVARVRAWEVEKQRYKLTQPWEGNGAIVYALKESMSNGEPAHWICTKCYEDGRKSILNGREVQKQLHAVFVCPVCKAEVQSAWGNVSAAEYAPE